MEGTADGRRVRGVTEGVLMLTAAVVTHLREYTETAELCTLAWWVLWRANLLLKNYSIKPPPECTVIFNLLTPTLP